MTENTTVGYESEKKGHPWLKIGFVLSALVIGLATATQVLAYRFDYHDALGPHFRYVYFPGMFLVWYGELGGEYPVEFRIAVSYGMAVAAMMLLVYVIVSRIVSQSARGNAKLHGTAHWATPREVKACGLLDNDEGVYVGSWKDRKGRLHYLRDNGPSHVLCFAPTRSGKGVGLVLPTLLSWKHSAVVSDLKGELWQLTSGWRKHHAGNIVLRFEPGSAESCARWNPLEEVRIGTPEETGDIRNLTETIIDPKGEGLKDFWMQSAANLLEAVITHILYKHAREGTPANMQAITYFLADPDRPDMKLEEKFQEMVEYKHYPDGGTNKLVASMGRAMLNKPENERGSVISTMDSVLGLYKDPVTAKNTEKSDFKIIDIMNHDKPVSLYLITTPDNKDRLCPLLRLLINMMLKKLAAHVDYKDGRTVMAHKRRLLMMLDEFPSFGKLQPIAEGLAFVAGYGLKIYIISQDTIQFDAVYGDKNSIISNCHIQVMFPPNRLETAKYISQMLGETTVVERQYSVSGKRAGMMHSQVTESIKSDKRPLLTTDEVMALSAHHAIIPTQARTDFKKLSMDEKRVYNLIARAYLVQFMPNHAWRRTSVTLAAGEHELSKSARVTLTNGWRDFFESDPEPDDADSDGTLPELIEGQEVHCDSCASVPKETKPRPLYSMASLLEDLTRVAQYVRDDKLRQALIDKDKGKAGEHGGIGTPATRDEILKTLFERGFLETRKSGRASHVISTKAGQEFYDILPDQAKFPDLTALWHEQQREIEEGTLARDAFVEANAAYIGGEVARVLEKGLGLKIEKHPCPNCGNAMFRRTGDKGAYWACADYPSCRATLPDDNGKPGTRNITVGAADPTVLCPGCGKPMRLINYATGAFFGCTGFPDCKKVMRAKDGKPDTSPNRPSVSEKHKCQQCGSGLVRRSGKDGKFFWGCSTFRSAKRRIPTTTGNPTTPPRTKQ